MAGMVTIDYFTDVLCVWAYLGQVRVDELEKQFGAQVRLRHRLIDIFGDAPTRVAQNWEGQGGIEGFRAHLDEVCAQWPHTHLHPQTWRSCQPASSTTAHIFLKAVSLLPDGQGGECLGRLQWRIRTAFFEHGLDVSRHAVLEALLEQEGVSPAAVRAVIESGAAYAALHADEELKAEHAVKGSPTFVFNEGRQVLYGNLGYRIIEANVRELLDRDHYAGEASWC